MCPVGVAPKGKKVAPGARVAAVAIAGSVDASVTIPTPVRIAAIVASAVAPRY